MNRKVFESDKPTVLKIDGKYHVVDVNNLVYVKTEKQYVLLYFSDSETPYRIKGSLADVLQVIPQGMLVSVSRFNLVNINMVRSFDMNFVVVEINGKKKLISLSNKRFKHYFYDIFGYNVCK